MRKERLAAFMLAAVLTAGSGMTAFADAASPAAEGWVQDAAGWWWRNADGTWPASQWKEVSGKWYYFESNGYMAADQWVDGTYYVGSDGAMLANTTTPDGYQVGADGAWDGNEPAQDHSQMVYSIWEATKAIDLNGARCEERTSPGGSIYYLISDDTTGFTIGESMNLDPQRVNVTFSSVSYDPDTMEIYPFSQDGTSISYPFDYNAAYELQIPQNPALRGKDLADYCKQRNLMVTVAFERPDELQVSMFYLVFE